MRNKAYSIDKKLSLIDRTHFDRRPPFVRMIGENWIHVSGFFPTLVNLIKSMDEEEFWLVNVEETSQKIELSIHDTETKYFEKINNNYSSTYNVPFSYYVCDQAFVGKNDWIILSSRDNETLEFAASMIPNTDLLSSISSLLWNDTSVERACLNSKH